MGLEDMISRIDEEARSEAESILREAREDSHKIKEKARADLEREIDDMERKLQKDISSIKNVHISDGKRRSRQIMLSAKEDMIWGAISGVRERLSSLDGDELSSYLIPMFERAVSSMGSDIRVYPVRKIDGDILKGQGSLGPVIEGDDELPSSVSRFREKDLLGGFIAATSDGDKIVNMSFAGIIEKEEDEIRELIAGILFGD